MPSIADKFRLALKSKAVNMDLIPFRINDPMTLGMPNGDAVTIHGKDAIYEKGMTPIPSGGKIRGWIRFRAEGISPELIRQKGTKLALTFVDVTDRALSVEYEWPDGPPPDHLSYLPASGSDLVISTNK